MKVVYFLLGSNLGDRQTYIREAIQRIGRHFGPPVTESSIYVSAPWGLAGQPDFLNQVIAVKTELSPHEGLSIIKEIEQDLGRTRSEKWGARTIDIDILFWGNEIMNEPALEIPHPGISRRRFTLVPLNEVAATLVHPAVHKTIAQLLAECEDSLPVNKLD